MTLTPLQREVETEPACSRCKRPISRLGDLYRCASCDAVFHRPCIYEHFGWSVNGEPHPSPRPTHGSPRGYAAVPIRGDVRHDVGCCASRGCHQVCSHLCGTDLHTCDGTDHNPPDHLALADTPKAPKVTPEDVYGDLARQKLEAAAVRAAILALHYERGRMQKVTVADFMAVLAAVRNLSDEALAAAALRDSKEARDAWRAAHD